MLNGYVQNLAKEIQEDLKIFTEEESIIKPTPENVLGYSLYPEQLKWIDFCYKHIIEGSYSYKDVQVRLLETSRDYGKTDIIILHCIPYLLWLFPKLTFIISTRKENRASKLTETIGYSMKSLGFKGVFNKESISLDSNKSKQPNVVIANNSTASLRGHHADILICDDIVISTDEGSPLEREKTKAFFREALNVTKTIILLGQPVHEDDLYANLKEIVDKKDTPKTNIKIMSSFYGSIPERDKNIEELQKLNTEREIQKNYFGKLISEGLYPFSDIRLEAFNFHGATIACIDPAFDGTDSIGIAIGMKDEDIYKVLAVKIEGSIHLDKLKVMELLQIHNVYECYIESNDSGGAFNSMKEVENPTGIVFKGYKESLKKSIKIRSRIGRVKKRMILHNESDYKLILYWTDKAEHDDCPDALAGLINFIDGNKEKAKVSYGNLG